LRTKLLAIDRAESAVKKWCSLNTIEHSLRHRTKRQSLTVKTLFLHQPNIKLMLW